MPESPPVYSVRPSGLKAIAHETSAVCSALQCLTSDQIPDDDLTTVMSRGQLFAVGREGRVARWIRSTADRPDGLPGARIDDCCHGPVAPGRAGMHIGKQVAASGDFDDREANAEGDNGTADKIRPLPLPQSCGHVERAERPRLVDRPTVRADRHLLRSPRQLDLAWRLIQRVEVPHQGEPRMPPTPLLGVRRRRGNGRLH